MFAIFLPLCILLSGCGGAALLVGGGLYSAHQLSSRIGPKGYLEDVRLKHNIELAFRAHDLKALGVLVFDKTVMIYGFVPNPKRHISIAKKYSDSVIDKTHRYNNTNVNPMHDALIKMQLKTKFLLNPCVPSRNLIIKVRDQIVYVLGVVHNSHEKDTILAALMQVQKVQRIEDHIDVRDIYLDNHHKAEILQH